MNRLALKILLQNKDTRSFRIPWIIFYNHSFRDTCHNILHTDAVFRKLIVPVS